MVENLPRDMAWRGEFRHCGTGTVGDLIGELSTPCPEDPIQACQATATLFRHPQITFPIMDACFALHTFTICRPSAHFRSSIMRFIHPLKVSMFVAKLIYHLPPPTVSQPQTCVVTLKE